MRLESRPATSGCPRTETASKRCVHAYTKRKTSLCESGKILTRDPHVQEEEEDEAEEISSPRTLPNHANPPRHPHDGTHRIASLLDSADQKLREQLLIASEKGRKHAVYLLLHQRELDRDRCRGMRGYTPLHHAATRGHLDVLHLLVSFGWRVDSTNDALETPLHLASYSGHAAIVEFLLDKGADANARSVDGETPLFYAARKHHDRVVRLLLRRECDLTITNRYGDVAQDEASSDKTLQEFATGREDLERLYRRRAGKGETRTQAFHGEVTLTQKLREDVLAFLDLRSLCRASQICYRWHRASDTPSLWRRLGVSRWELQLQTCVGIGAVSPMALLVGGGRRLQLAGSTGSVRRPSSCDQSTSGSRFVGDHRRPQTARHPGL